MPVDQVLRRATIDGEFEGFDEDKLFALSDGTYWIQDEYRYWYHYSYCPRIEIYYKSGRTHLRVEGQTESVPVRQIFDVIQSNIDGEFRGWDGSSRYTLRNGQVWEQSVYKYEYKYQYNPEAIIYDSNGGYLMQVAGTSARVRRIR